MNKYPKFPRRFEQLQLNLSWKKSCEHPCEVLTALCIGVTRGGGKGTMAPQKFLENVILCFERRFSKQNSVIRLKSNILALQIFGLAMTLGLW